MLYPESYGKALSGAHLLLQPPLALPVQWRVHPQRRRLSVPPGAGPSTVAVISTCLRLVKRDASLMSDRSTARGTLAVLAPTEDQTSVPVCTRRFNKAEAFKITWLQ